MILRQGLQGFPDTRQVSLKKKKKELTFLKAVAAGSREVTVSFNFYH
jgi:hypothetical protein